jgi:NTP pyrophosphatase (non-canonical NTP hydrolase)
MNLKEFVELANTTRSELGSIELNNIHMALGLGTESGELQDVFKKNLAYGKPIDWINVQEEIGDLCWYLAGLCQINNFDFEKILDRCIEKLKVRYPNKFNSDDAINRNLEKEREILEK